MQIFCIYLHSLAFRLGMNGGLLWLLIIWIREMIFCFIFHMKRLMKTWNGNWNSLENQAGKMNIILHLVRGNPFCSKEILWTPKLHSPQSRYLDFLRNSQIPCISLGHCDKNPLPTQLLLCDTWTPVSTDTSDTFQLRLPVSSLLIHLHWM